MFYVPIGPATLPERIQLCIPTPTRAALENKKALSTRSTLFRHRDYACGQPHSRHLPTSRQPLSRSRSSLQLYSSDGGKSIGSGGVSTRLYLRPGGVYAMRWQSISEI